MSPNPNTSASASANASLSPLFVAIDIGKNVNCYGAFVGYDLVPLSPTIEGRNTRAGYAQFRAWLDPLLASGTYAPVVVGLEPTGCYHEPWLYALTQPTPGLPELAVRLISPYQTQQQRRQTLNGRPRKTDPLDVAAQSRCLRDGVGRPVTRPSAAALQFELWAQDYRQACLAHRRLTTQVLAQLDRLWPGALINVKAFQKAHPTLAVPAPLVRSQPLARQVVRLLIEQRPNPYDWQGQSLADIQAFCRGHGLRCGLATASRVAAVAQAVLLLPPDLAAVLAARLQQAYARWRASEQALALLHQAGIDLLPSTPGQVLLSVPGMSPLLAAQYTAYVGDGQRFTHADQIWAWAGFDVLQSDSGDRRHAGHITRRGEAGLREVLYSVGLKTSQACEEIAQARQHALANGKGRVGAVLHAAHKANRLCFALLTQQVPYTRRAGAG